LFSNVVIATKEGPLLVAIHSPTMWVCYFMFGMVCALDAASANSWDILRGAELFSRNWNTSRGLLRIWTNSIL